MGRIAAAAALAVLLAACAAPTPTPPASPPPEAPPEVPTVVETPPAPPLPPVAPAANEGPTPVEWCARRKRPEGGVLATTPYKVGDEEKPFFDALPEKERTTGTMFSDYAVAGKVGASVGWFGIVRGIREDAAAGVTRLLVEQKYFDGLQDSHILCTSFHGAGDFVATLRGTGHGIPLLCMVKVYGTVASEKDGVPRLPATFVRVFPHGTFTFMGNYGKPAGNGAWRALCTVPSDALYSPSPGEAYYRARLGEPGDSAEVPE